MMYPLYQKLKGYSFETLLKTFSHKKDLMVLGSSLIMQDYGRYSFICFDAFASFMAKNKRLMWNDHCIDFSDPFDFIKNQLEHYQLQKHPDLPPFQGGVVGYFGYEASHYLETFESLLDPIDLPDIYLYFYSQCIAVDHVSHESWVICTGFPETERPLRLKKAQEDLDQMIKDIASYQDINEIENRPLKKPVSNFSKAAYEKAVMETKDYILSGDIFEANISQQFMTTFNEAFEPMALYLKLIRNNPSPFSAFLTLPDRGYLISASPERFVQNREQKIWACPIKGTIKRSSEQKKDDYLAQQLLKSEKDRAENIMIVDLMRNDFSKICKPGSIEVDELCALKSFSTVHHLVSSIRGELKKGVTLMDILKATFPAGSITGAPKIRAMEVIAELEKQARGPYCGCLGYFSFTGEMDTSVIIRTYYLHEDRLYFSAGGAVTLESDPEQEYAESMLKAKALIEVLTNDTVD